MPSDPEVKAIVESPGAVECFREMRDSRESKEPNKEDPPLVRHAKVLAMLIDPPQPKGASPVIRQTAKVEPRAPIVRPPNPSPKFTVRGISYNASRPDDSIALIWEPGIGLHWIRQGARIGHLVVEKIEPGALVYRNGEQLNEMPIERMKTPVHLVRTHRKSANKPQIDEALDKAENARPNAAINPAMPVPPMTADTVIPSIKVSQKKALALEDAKGIGGQ